MPNNRIRISFLSCVWFEYFLKNKQLNVEEIYLKLPIDKKTIENHIETFKSKKIINCNLQFSKEFIQEHKKQYRDENFKVK